MEQEGKEQLIPSSETCESNPIEADEAHGSFHSPICDVDTIMKEVELQPSVREEPPTTPLSTQASAQDKAQAEDTPTTSRTSKKGQRRKDATVEYYGKVLQTDICESVIERLKVKCIVPCPKIPLCRMMRNESIRTVREDLGRLKLEFGRLGYVESKGSFLLSIVGPNGDVQEVTEAIMQDWDDVWRQVNTEFEEDLRHIPEWSFLSNRMFYVWDGNNRLKAFIEKVKEGMENT